MKIGLDDGGTPLPAKLHYISPPLAQFSPKTPPKRAPVKQYQVIDDFYAENSLPQEELTQLLAKWSPIVDELIARQRKDLTPCPHEAQKPTP